MRLSGLAFDGSTLALTHIYAECGLDKQVISKNLCANIKIYKACSNFRG